MDFSLDIIRHPRENRKKCTLRNLVGRSGIRFHVARDGFSFDASGRLLLCLDGEEISERHANIPLVLLDSTWRLLPKLRAKVYGDYIPVSLPKRIKTAYPRDSKLFGDPQGGLASIEALYAALRLSGLRDDSLLDGYLFAGEFLRQNFPE